MSSNLLNISYVALTSFAQYVIKDLDLKKHNKRTKTKYQKKEKFYT